MEKFVHQQNLAYYRKMLADKWYESRRVQILKLLADEEAKDEPLPCIQWAASDLSRLSYFVP